MKKELTKLEAEEMVYWLGTLATKTIKLKFRSLHPHNKSDILHTPWWIQVAGCWLSQENKSPRSERDLDSMQESVTGKPLDGQF